MGEIRIKKLDVGIMKKGRCVLISESQSYEIDLNNAVDLIRKILFCSVRATHYHTKVILSKISSESLCFHPFPDILGYPTHQIYIKNRRGT